MHSQTNDDFQNLGKIKFPQSSSIKSNYVYDSKNNVYIYSKTIDNYPINTPLVLKPDEFEYLIIKENIKKILKKKLNFYIKIMEILRKSKKTYYRNYMSIQIFSNQFLEVT